MFEALLRPFTAKKPPASAAQQRAAAQEVAAKLQAAREDLEAARTAHGPLLLKAMAAGDGSEAAKLREALAAKESAVRDLEALAATTQAAARKVDEAEANAALLARWDQACRHGTAVNAAAADLQEWARTGGPLMQRLLDAREALLACVPQQPGVPVTGAAQHEFVRLAELELALHARPLCSRIASGSWAQELLQGPTLTDRVRDIVARLLAHAPAESQIAARKAAQREGEAQ